MVKIGNENFYIHSKRQIELMESLNLVCSRRSIPLGLVSIGLNLNCQQQCILHWFKWMAGHEKRIVQTLRLQSSFWPQ